MREFVVVSRGSAPLGAELKKALGQPDLRGSLFRAEHVSFAAPHGGHTAVAFRYLVRPAVEIPSRFFDGLAIVGGRLVRDEMHLGSTVDPRGFAGTARGAFSLLAVEPDRVGIFCDPLSVYPLWYWQSDDLFVCSNNTHLIRSVLKELAIPVEKSVRFFAWQLIFQNGVDNSTGYEGIRWTPFGHYVNIVARDGRVEVAMKPLEASSTQRLFRSEEPADALIERAHAEIAENVLAMADGAFSARVCDLSGGLDTRVMLAALLGQGLGDRFGFNTAGTTSTADGNLAALIRERYGLRRSMYVPRPARGVPAFSVELCSMLFRTYGCFSQYTSVGLGLRSDRAMLHLNGGCGETFRGPHSAGLTGEATALDRLTRQVNVHGGMIRAEVRDELAETLADQFAAKARAGFSDADAGDQHYIEHRNRQFMGTQCRSRLNFQSLAYPLYSTAAIAAAFSASRDRRGAAGIHFALVNRMFPELLEIPLQGRVWAPALYVGHPRAQELSDLEPVMPDDARMSSPDAERTISFERATYPVYPVARPTTWERTALSEGRHWSWVHLESSLAWLRELLTDTRLLDRMGTVFEPSAVRKFSERELGEFTNSTEVRHVYRLLATLLWLGDLELAIPLRAHRP